MNKHFFYYLLILCSLIFLSCKIELSDSKNLSRPDVVSQSESGILVSRSLLSSSVTYVNVYRKDVTDLTDESEATIVNIGLVFPKTNSSKDETITFEDVYVIQNHKYRYQLRYYDSDGYYYTDWSDKVTAEKGQSSSTTLKYSLDSSAYFIFDKDTYSLKFTGTYTAPTIPNFASDFTPVIAFSNGTKTLVFALSDEILAGTGELNLRSLLPADFFGVALTLQGLFGQKIVKSTSESNSSDPEIYRIIWTEPVEVKISNYKTITIPSSATSTNYDYSRAVLR